MSDVVTRLNEALAGRYRIGRGLGEGGMATVYLADDLKHERKVALKVLRPELAAVVGAERFLAEIKTTANLQHPHILPLFDSGEADKFLFYVMPYVEGETLRERIDREKQLGVDEALALTRKIADALDYAHEHGVVHRDIKPGNILLSQRGEPLVADFGIALAVAQAGGGRITETGLSLGTPHYMSPEQATGDRDVDPRSDVYALGCVLYEMLSGEPPFSASTAQAVLAKILTMDAPSITLVRRTVPPSVGAALAKALEKLPADRFATAAAFAAALADPAFTYEARARTQAAPAATARSAGQARPWIRDRRSLAALATAALLAVLAGGEWLTRPAAPTPGVPTRAEIPGLDVEINNGGWRVAISRDGRSIVVGHREEGAADPALYVRSAGSLQLRRLPNTENGTDPAFSPDGQWIVFNRRSQGNWRVPVAGGTDILVSAGGNSPRWADDDVIVYSDGGAIYRVAGSGGDPQLLFQSDSLQPERPFLLPGGKAFVFSTSTGGNPLNGRVMLAEVASGEVRELVPSGNQPVYVPTGHLVYGHGDGTIMAVRFDLATLRTQGTPFPVVSDVSVYSGGASQFAVSETGTLVYLSGAGVNLTDGRSLVWVDRDGMEQTIPSEPRRYRYLRLSSNDGRVAVGDPENFGIRIWDFASRTSRLLLVGDARSISPVWSPDGSRIAYSDAATGDLRWRAANNTGEPAALAERAGPGSNSAPYFFTPDGTGLVFGDQGNDGDLVMISLPGGDVQWRLNGPFQERNAELSPDGHWMAYQSDESGRFEIYVRPFPDVEADQIPISSTGGSHPVWSRDGSELLYLGPGPQLVSVPVDTGGRTFVRGDPRALLEEWPYYWDDGGRSYDVARDGRFLAIKLPEGSIFATGTAYIVTHWFEELKERMGG